MKKAKGLIVILVCLIFVFDVSAVLATGEVVELNEPFVPTEIGETWEMNGINYTVVDTMPIVWDFEKAQNATGQDFTETSSIIPITITVSIGYAGSGKLECIITAGGGLNALLKYMNGTISTWGVAGSHSDVNFNASNFIPGSYITAEATFNYLYLTETGTQYTKTKGTVSDVYGNTGSFGPSVGSATIRP